MLFRERCCIIREDINFAKAPIRCLDDGLSCMKEFHGNKRESLIGAYFSKCYSSISAADEYGFDDSLQIN